MGIFLVYAVIRKVKNRIKAQNEQHLFRRRGKLPFLIHSSTSRSKILTVCSFDQKLKFLVLFLISKGLETNQLRGVNIFRGEGGCFRVFFFWGSVFSVGSYFPRGISSRGGGDKRWPPVKDKER